MKRRVGVDLVTEPPPASEDEKSAGSAAKPAGPGRRTHRWRRIAWTLLFVAFLLLGPLSVVAVWARNLTGDTDRYVETVAPLARNQAIQDAVATEISAAIKSELDVDQMVRQVLSPDQQVLASALTASLNAVIDDLIADILRSPQFATIWDEINRAAHRQIVAVLTGEEGDLLSVQEGAVVLDLTPVVVEVEARLRELGIELPESAPLEGPTTSFVIFEAAALETAKGIFRLLDQLALVLPLIFLASLAGLIWLAPDRRVAVRRAGLGLAIALTALLILIAVGRSLYLDLLKNDISPDAAAAFFDTMLRFLRSGTRALVVLGLVVAAGAAIAGREGAAQRLRSWTASRLGEDATHERIDEIGRWVGAHRALLRVGLIVAGCLALVAWDRPTLFVMLSLAMVVAIGFGAISLVSGRAVARPVKDSAPPML